MATILIVDDDPQVTSAIGAFFERGGHHVVRAAGGKDAIDAYHAERFDLVLLDVRMPEVDGFEVLSRIGGDDAVVIMITGHGDIELAVRAMREGAENFLTKPIDLHHLGAAAEHALEKKRVRQAKRHARRSLADVERAHIERTLHAHNENRTRAARELGISRATLIHKIKIYGLESHPPSRAMSSSAHSAVTS
ncbi:MAG: response regulator [Gemmatimonadota bacterium]|nr:response regulator [Gemmatimonadota bacterium]